MRTDPLTLGGVWLHRLDRLVGSVGARAETMAHGAWLHPKMINSQSPLTTLNRVIDIIYVCYSKFFFILGMLCHPWICSEEHCYRCYLVLRNCTVVTVPRKNKKMFAVSNTNVR